MKGWWNIHKKGGKAGSSIPPDFDWKVYLAVNSDLRRANITTEKAALKHWVIHGQFENRKFKFDARFHDRLPADALGINLFGYFDSEFGIAENSRHVYGSLSGRIPFSLFPVSAVAQLSEDRSVAITGENTSFSYPVNLFCLDAAQTEDIIGSDFEFFRHKTNIALWPWELEIFPERWTSVLPELDEVWTISDYCREALEKVSPAPVVRIDVPLEIREERISDYFPGYCREKRIGAETFKVVCCFDYLSDILRKNPIGAIDAFNGAFAAGDDVVLFLKSINGDKLPIIAGFLEEHVRGSPLADKIFILDECLRKDDSLSILKNCDCLISLHRAEGQGRNLMEAMCLGKPVIATGYSGNLDFMNEENSLLVRYTPVNVASSAGMLKGLKSGGEVSTVNAYIQKHYLDGYYSEHGRDCDWAEPDAGQAASCLRRIFEDSAYRDKIGRRGRQDIRERYSLERCGAIMRKRIEDLYGARFPAAAGGNRGQSTAGGKIACIHIGLPKTGTTLLQRNLFAKHSEIDFLGVFVGEGCGAPNRDSRYGFRGRDQEINRLFNEIIWNNWVEPDLSLCRGIYERGILPSLDEGKTPLWSFESLVDDRYEIRLKRANNLRSVFGDAKILVTIRRPVDLIHSQFLNDLKRNNINRHYCGEAPFLISIDEWFEKHKPNPAVPPRSFLDYARTIGMYAQVFGKEAVRVQLFEQLVEDQERFVRATCEFLEIGADEGVSLTSGKRENVNWSREQFEILQGIKRSWIRSRIFRYSSSRRKRRVLGFDDSSKVPDRGEKLKIEIDESWKEWIAETTREGNRYLAENWDLPLKEYGYPL